MLKQSNCVSYVKRGRVSSWGL